MKNEIIVVTDEFINNELTEFQRLCYEITTYPFRWRADK